MSLRDQLLKAGLVDAGKVRKTEAEKRKKGHKLKKDSQLAADEAQRQQAEKDRQAREIAAKREKDRALNREREALKRERERQAAALQLIASHQQSPDGEEAYHFVDGRWIRNLRVSDTQQRQLSCGQLGIVRGESENQYLLLPRQAVERLQDLSPDRVLLLHEPGDGDEFQDDQGADPWNE